MEFVARDAPLENPGDSPCAASPTVGEPRAAIRYMTKKPDDAEPTYRTVSTKEKGTGPGSAGQSGDTQGSVGSCRSRIGKRGRAGRGGTILRGRVDRRRGKCARMRTRAKSAQNRFRKMMFLRSICAKKDQAASEPNLSTRITDLAIMSSSSVRMTRTLTRPESGEISAAFCALRPRSSSMPRKL